MSQTTTLPNGLTVITESLPGVHSFCLAVYVATGSRYERPEDAGISHFVEHMLFKGSTQFPTARAIAESIEGVGGLLNAGTEKELTTYVVKVAAHHTQLALELIADMLLHPLLDAVEVKKERQVIIEELHMSEDVPQELVNTLIDELIWPDHPLGREIAGTEDTVRHITRTKLRQHVSGTYVPNNTVIAAAGVVDHAHIVNEVTRLFQGWRRKATAPFMPATIENGSQTIRHRFRSTEQAHVCLSFGGLSRGHPQRFALDVLHVILGGGMSSRLFQEVRERRSLAYDIATYNDYLQDTGAGVVYVGTDPSRAVECVRAIVHELACLRDAPVQDGELSRAREYLKGRMLLGMEDSLGVAAWLGSQQLFMGRTQTVDEILWHFDQVTVEELQALAREMFNPRQYRLAVVSPQLDERRLSQLLQQS